jgi:hypothetical protein
MAFMTATSAEWLARRMAGCPFVGLLCKPFALDDVLAVVRRISAPSGPR